MTTKRNKAIYETGKAAHFVNEIYNHVLQTVTPFGMRYAVNVAGVYYWSDKPYINPTNTMEAKR